MHIFPEISDVFASDANEHRKYLLPLLTVDLSSINADWDGPIHFVEPIEPYSGPIGEGTQKYHTYLCREEWIGYKIINGKYQLDADFCFFQKRYIAKNLNFRQHFTEIYSYLDDAYFQELPQVLEKHYTETNSNYESKKNAFITGELNYDYFTHGLRLGGKPLEGNWSMGFPIEFEEQFAYPLTKDGRRFCYIGSVEPYLFGIEHDCVTLLFYDPKDQVVLNAFDYT